MDKKENLTVIAQNFLYYDVNSAPTGDISILGIGHEICLPDKMEGPKSFSFYSMHIVLGGKGTISINGRKFSVSARQIFVLPPEAELVYYPDPADPWEYIWCNFLGPNAVKFCLRCNLTPDTPVFTAVTPQIIDAALALTKLHNMRFSLDIATVGHFYDLFALMIDSLCSAQSSETSSVQEQSVLAAIEYIRQNYSSPQLNLRTTADEIGLHFNYLSQLFKKITGCTFNRYLNMFRIQKACELLDSGEKYISSVAERVGFTDQLYFSKVFKKYKIVSPKYYRAEIKSE